MEGETEDLAKTCVWEQTLVIQDAANELDKS